jgi:hypothetical protein
MKEEYIFECEKCKEKLLDKEECIRHSKINGHYTFRLGKTTARFMIA